MEGNKMQKIKEVNHFAFNMMTKRRTVVHFKKLSPDAIQPVKQTSISPGYDLFSAVHCEILPGKRACIGTNVAVALPVGTYARVACLPELAKHYGVIMGGGLVEPEIEVVLFNLSETEFVVKKGDRIAQLVMEAIHHTEASLVTEEDENEYNLKMKTKDQDGRRIGKEERKRLYCKPECTESKQEEDIEFEQKQQ